MKIFGWSFGKIKEKTEQQKSAELADFNKRVSFAEAPPEEVEILFMADGTTRTAFHILSKIISGEERVLAVHKYKLVKDDARINS